jgi:hypothetical protein
MSILYRTVAAVQLDTAQEHLFREVFPDGWVKPIF